MMFGSRFINQFVEGDHPPKILVIEGPDGSGKSMCVSQIEDACSNKKDLRVLRFPGNRIHMPFRDMIMSPEVEAHPLVSPFLFMADFVYTFEQQILPFWEDPDVQFVCDRGFPSTVIYQQVDLMWINQIFREPKFRTMWECMAQAHYVYLQVPSLDVLKTRLGHKRGEEINRLDPASDVMMQKQIFDYNGFVKTHLHVGVLGSRFVETWER